jgi:hypothetical protein
MLELEDAAKSLQQEKEYTNALPLTNIFSYNINECIKEHKVCESLNYDIDLQFRIL